jgi:hypothetical protein
VVRHGYYLLYAHLPNVRGIVCLHGAECRRLLVLQRPRPASCSAAGLGFWWGLVRWGCGFVEFGAPALLGAVVVERAEAES